MPLAFAEDAEPHESMRAPRARDRARRRSPTSPSRGTVTGVLYDALVRRALRRGAAARDDRRAPAATGEHGHVQRAARSRRSARSPADAPLRAAPDVAPSRRTAASSTATAHAEDVPRDRGRPEPRVRGRQVPRDARTDRTAACRGSPACSSIASPGQRAEHARHAVRVRAEPGRRVAADARRARSLLRRACCRRATRPEQPPIEPGLARRSARARRRAIA